MIQNLRKLIGFTVRSQDGEIGTIDDFYFDDNRWVVRYLVVDSRNWLDGRRLLFAPRALSEIDFQDKILTIPLDLETIRSSPLIEAGQPFGREQEIALHNYYQWPFYWTPGDAGGLGPGSVAAYPLVELAEEMAEKGAHDPLENPNLCSFTDFSGFKLKARDGDIGSIADILVNDEDWNILYLIVDTGRWLPGRKVLVSPNWVKKVNASDSEIEIDLSQDTIRNSPEYDQNLPLERDYENRLYEHYGKEKYW